MTEYLMYKRSPIGDRNFVGALDFVSDNTASDYLTSTYSSQPNFTGNLFGSFWIRMQGNPNASTKRVISWNNGDLSVAIDHAPGDDYDLLFIEPSGRVFRSNIVAEDPQWMFFYFYCDFVNPSDSFVRLNRQDIGFDVIPAAITAPSIALTECSLFRESTFNADASLARIWVDSNPNVSQSEWLLMEDIFITEGQSFGPHKIGNFGEIPLGTPPSLCYSELSEAARMDNIDADFTVVGDQNYQIEESVQVFRVVI